MKLISCNIEWDRHLDTVIPFIKETRPDVLCLQELLEPDIPLFEEIIGGKGYFVPTMCIETSRGTVPEGIGIFSRYAKENVRALPYSGSVGASYLYSASPETWDKDYELRALAAADVLFEGGSYRILTTHFNWTQKGTSTPEQLQAMQRMLELLKKEEPFILAGDMNAPRGGNTFSLLADVYIDHIPAQYTGSVDVALHKAGKIDGERLSTLMVDGLFTTSEYSAKDVRLEFGVSDHAAIVATIERNT